MSLTSSAAMRRRGSTTAATTAAIIAATAALEHAGRWRDEFLAHCTRKRDLAIARLNALPGVRVARPPQATFVLFADIRDHDHLVTGGGHDLFLGQDLVQLLLQ